MTRPPDPAGMSPADVQAELAAIFARGWWRMWLCRKRLDDLASNERACANPVNERPGHPQEAITP